MCEKCVERAAERERPKSDELGRVFSLADFSAALVDAFQESDGVHTAVAFALNGTDIVPVFGVKYDRNRQCIVVNIGYADTDINQSRTKEMIREVNGR